MTAPARLMCLGDCGYALTTPLARARGYGHRCWARLPPVVRAAIAAEIRPPAPAARRPPRIPRIPRTRPTGPAAASPDQLEITDPTEETRLMPDPTPPTTPADDAADRLADARLDHLVDRARFCRAGCDASYATEQLVEEIRRLRHQLDAATVWWLEGDNEYAEPDVYATQQLAQDAALREFRTANFPELQAAAHDWQPEEHGDGTELVVAGERTRLIVRRLTVRTSAGPLESAVTEALAAIAADPHEIPAPPAPWLLPEGDD